MNRPITDYDHSFEEPRLTPEQEDAYYKKSWPLAYEAGYAAGVKAGLVKAKYTMPRSDMMGGPPQPDRFPDRFALIDLDGSVLGIDLPYEQGDISLSALYAAIGCSMVEAVQLDPDLTLWVDEEGKLNGKLVNELATRMMRGRDVIAGIAVLTGGTDEEGAVQPISTHGWEKARRLMEWPL